jgi:chloramphenicol-sensitive protein RarD
VPENRTGILLGLAAYMMWGAFPAFFKILASIPPSEILAHRIIWSAVFLLLFVLVTGERERLYAIFRDRRAVLVLLATTCLLAVNWFTFLTAVTGGRVLESSLGYYINPLVSVLLGSVFLREHLSVRQKVSIVLAAAGVLVQTFMVGKVPLISLVLAFSFGSYGLVRKSAKVRPVPGLTVEMVLLIPAALGYMMWLINRGKTVYPTGITELDILLVLSGVVTATPLILFGGALLHLRLSTIGIMQYIVPTGHFLLAVVAYNEPFTIGHLVSFAFIWAALLLYMSESLNAFRSTTPAAV